MKSLQISKPVEQPTTNSSQTEIKNFSIRLLASELTDIKTHIQVSKTRFKKQSIHSFILEAVAEKLQRDKVSS